MKPSRRRFLQGSFATAALAWLPPSLRGRPLPARPLTPREATSYPLRLGTQTPVRIASIEVLRAPGEDPFFFVRTRSDDGAEGISQSHRRIQYLLPILEALVAPFFLGQDARELERLVDDDVYRHDRNYKYAGMPFWLPVGAIELSLLDLLGKVENKPVSALFGEVRRREVPVYASTFERDETAEATIEELVEDLEGSGAEAVKLKIGGRMSNNRDALPGRTEALVPLARRTFGDDFTLYVDANGSYDAEKGIEVGRMLEDQGVALYEEPCPWQDYESTRLVTKMLDLTVAGGEQDSSLWQFEDMVMRRVVDLVQPDFFYNGGFIRCLRVAQMAEALGAQITPHSPIWGPAAAIKTHFAAIVPNVGAYQEHRARQSAEDWYEPSFVMKNGVLHLPEGPGWGVTLDPECLRRAEVVASVSTSSAAVRGG